MGRTDLQPGQYVQFNTYNDLDTLSDKERNIYQADRIFLVISREDAPFDPCECYLVDNNLETYRYSPRTSHLGYAWLENDYDVSDASTNALGEETKQVMHAKAQELIAAKKQYFTANNVQTLNTGSRANHTAQSEAAKEEQMLKTMFDMMSSGKF